jgi:RHS repeat-associated protein
MHLIESSTFLLRPNAGGQRVALRKDDVVSYLLTDHLGSTAVTANTSGVETGELRYKAWGEERYASGTTPTTYRFTGQRAESLLGLSFYGARWYDSSLSRWVQPDSDVPESQGVEWYGVGYAGSSTLSPLVVDYHDNQYLELLNSENRARLQNPDFRRTPVPTNPIAFDRYAYSLNNPVRYVDPSGHNPILAILIFIPGWGWFAIGAVALAGVVYYAAGGPEAVGEALYQAGEAVSDGLSAAFAGRYSGDPRTAGEIIGQEKQGRIKGEFPTDLLGKTYDEIVGLAKQGKGAIRDKARTAKKLPDSHEYDKGEKR